jgi:DHA2 family methylenomycin A resistance protein-like MFS transporter
MNRRIYQDPRIVALIAAMGLGSVMFDNTAVTTAIPSIQIDFNAETSALQWILSAMSITTGTVLPFAGAFGDKWGALKAFRIGLTIFGLGAFLASFATTFPMLLACRIFQGCGLAFMLPNGGAILSANVDPNARNRAVGLWISFSSAGLVLGPLVGGYLTQTYTWHQLFYCQPVISLIGIALTFMLHESDTHKNINPLDIRGILSISLATLLFSAGVIDFGRVVPHPLIDSLLILVGAFLYLAFYRIEKSVAYPLIDPAWFKSRRVRGVLIACFIYNATIPAATLLIALFSQKTLEFSPRMGGLVILLMCILMPLGSNILGKVKSSNGLRTVMLLASFLLGIDYIVVAIFAQSPVPIFLLTLIFSGLFAGILFGGDTVAVMESLEPAKAASGLAALSMVRQISAVIGIAMIGTISEVIGNYANNAVTGRLWGIAVSGIITFGAWVMLRDGLRKDQLA